MSGRSKSKRKRRNERKVKRHLGTLSRKGRKLFLGKKKGPVPKRKKSRTNIEILQDARVKMCIVTGVRYEEVLKLRDELKAKGIAANITTGGLQIHTNAKNKVVLELCKKYKTIPEPGVSRFVEDVMLRK